MANIITIAYTTEGSTDKRFLESIIKKTFEEIAIKCEGSIEVYDPVYIKPNKNGTFIDNAELLLKEAFEIGSNVVCFHIDADDTNDHAVFQYKVEPINDLIEILGDDICKNVVSIVPVRMSEAWMLADKILLKEEIGTVKTDAQLNINKHSETIADPKELIVEALRIAQDNLPKRRNRITINELYQPIGQRVSIIELEKLPSFQKFKASVEAAFIKLNFLH
ncbi:DUF4276 family protein [bacterium]|nr:MAG: DUF4276 family protein [bacterium]